MRAAAIVAARLGRVGTFAQTFLGILVLLVWLLVLARVLLSWVDPAGRAPGAGLVFQATEPILAPIRRLIPPAGMLDLSAFILLIVLSALMRALL